jgi:hypothetical protein
VECNTLSATIGVLLAYAFNDGDQPQSMIQWIFVVIRPKAESMCISFLPVGRPTAHIRRIRAKIKTKTRTKMEREKIKREK